MWQGSSLSSPIPFVPHALSAFGLHLLCSVYGEPDLLWIFYVKIAHDLMMSCSALFLLSEGKHYVIEL